MARKTKNELDIIKKQYNVSKLWSFSRINQWLTDKYTYFLKYIEHITPDRDDGIYGTSGGRCHDIMEKFYDKEDTAVVSNADMLAEYEDALIEFDLLELKYNKSDEDANLKIANKYEACVKHFFLNHIPIKSDNINIEDFILIKVGKQLFQGYVDFWHTEKNIDENEKEKDIYIITDWKTSTIYTGEKILKEGRQLLLYALGMSQLKNIKLSDIKIRWNFMKYASVTYPQANGALKTRSVERHVLIEKIKSPLKMWLMKKGYEDELDYYLDSAIDENNLNILPQEVKELFVIEDCYVYIPIDNSTINELKKTLLETIVDIEKNTLEYETNQDDSIFYQEVNDKNSYYFNNLCEFSTRYHKPYKEYIDNLKLFIDDDTEDEEDTSWMDDLLG